MKKRWQWSALTVLLILSGQMASAGAESGSVSDPYYYYSSPQEGSTVGVTLNGLPLNLGGASPIKSTYSIMVPLRALAERIGANVQWNDQSRTALVSSEVSTIRFTADSKTVMVNQSATEMPEEAFVYNGRLLVPMVMLKSLVNKMEYEIMYSNQNNLIQITSHTSPVSHS